jgi:integrase
MRMGFAPLVLEQEPAGGTQDIGAFRRSELVSLDRSDVTFSVEGAGVALRRSKTDQEGQGSVKAIAHGSHKDTCPVRALQDWLSAAGISEGPISRPVNRHGQVGAGRLSGKAVALVIKRLAPLFGLDPAEVGGHSLRAGLITDLYKKGTPEAVIMAVSGHRSRNVLGRYRREADAFDQVAAVRL